MRVDPLGLVGQTIEGRYLLQSVVGEGGFGVVYRGEQVAFRTPVAVKFLTPRSSSPDEQEQLRERFRAEAVLLEKLNRCSPDVVRVLDLGVHALSPSRALPYLVMEWLDGRPLDEALASWRGEGRVPMPERRAVELLMPALQALAAAHRGDAGAVVAHRDIKPQNLFVPSAGGMKVLDLGIAKVMLEGEGVTALQSQTSSGFSAFSPLYGAPEQFHPKMFGQTGPWTDVHALGLLLVELVSGRRALDGDDYPTCFAASIMGTRPTPRACGAQVSDAFERVCARALSLDPRQRYQSADELISALLHPESVEIADRADAKVVALTDAIGRENDPRRKASKHAELARHLRDVAGDVGRAAASFRDALGCDPDAHDERRALIQLHEQADQLDQAVQQSEELVRRELRAEEIRTLHRLHLRRGAIDAAYCAAAALVALGAATDEERAYFEAHRPTSSFPVLKAAIRDESWSRLLFVDEVRAPITRIFEAVAPAAVALQIEQARASGPSSVIGRGLLQDPKNTTVTFARIFGWVAHVLHLEAVPLFYVRTDLLESLVDAVGERLAVVAGQKAMCIPPNHFLFLCAQHLTAYRPEFLLRTLFATASEMELFLMMSICAVRPGFSPPGAHKAATSLAPMVKKHLTHSQLERLDLAVQAFFDQGTKTSLRSWIQGVERTAMRAALLLGGDLEIARQVLASEREWPGRPTAAEKYRELLAYSVSTLHVEARKELGLSRTDAG